MDYSLEPVIRPIIIVNEHGWTEYCAWWAQILVTLIAVVAANVAWRQLNEMTDYRGQRLKIANATLLMELDHRFDSKELSDARTLFTNMRDEASKAISANSLLANDRERMEKTIEEWTSRLAKMRNDAKDDYAKLLSIGGFFETVGMMVKRGYISEDDAVELFKGPIIAFGRNFSPHISSRQKETGVPEGLFEHALYLYSLAQKST